MESKCLSAWLCRQALDERLHTPTVWMLHPSKPAGVYRSVHRSHDQMELEEYCKCRMEYTEPISSKASVGDCLATLPALTETSLTLHTKFNFLLLLSPTLTLSYTVSRDAVNPLILIATVHRKDVGVK